MTTPARVVLLRDGSWPDGPGVCCWRFGVESAFTAAGAAMVQVSREPSPVLTTVRNSQPRMAWLPPTIRRPLAWTYRRWRSRRRTPSLPRDRELAAQLTGASLVIAESPAMVPVALATGVPSRRVWVLFLPQERMFAGDVAGLAAELADVVRRIGGVLTDSEPAREEIERALSHTRPLVEVMPPVAVDRPCPTCRNVAVTVPAGAAPEAAQLALWRTLLDRAPCPIQYSFPAARFRGVTAGWIPAERSSWNGPPSAETQPAEPVQWTADRQVRAARGVLDAVDPPTRSGPRPARSTLVSGHELKFAVELANRLHRLPDLDVTVDEWPALGRGTPHTTARLARAESIFAEWARTSAVWLSQRKRPDQLLAVRLHRFELDSPYSRELAIENVDAVVYIAPLFGRRIRDELGWPVEKLVYIPNFIDLPGLDRPKLPEARFVLGFVGIEWERKRFDLALDILAALRREDRRFTLVARSVMPWKNQYAWAQPEEREYAGWCFARIATDPLLREGVFLDPPGRDMARWYRRVGHVLSTSDAEGCHTAVGEGMASGAVPVIRPWPGAEEIYDRQWIHGSIKSAVSAILANADESRWAAQAAHAKAEINVTYDPAAVVAAWSDLLHGDLAAARAYFAEYSGLPSLAR